MSSRKSSFFCLFLWYFFTYFTSSLIALLTHCLPITDEVSIKSVMIRQYALRVEVLTLNRPLLWLQLYFDATGNVIRCPLLSKLKLGLELKQKYPPKPQILTILTPHFWSGWRYIFPWPWNSLVCCSSVVSVQGSCFLRDRGIREFVVARLTMCGFLF